MPQIGPSLGPVIAIGTFVLVLGIVIGIYWLFVERAEGAAHRQLRSRLKVDGGARPGRARLLQDAERLSHLGLLEELLSKAGRISSPLQRKIAQSGVKMTVGTLMLSTICGLLLGYLFFNTITHQPAVSLVGAIVIGGVPYGYISRAKTKRLLKFEEQFPEAIDLIARTLRAGHAFATGLKLAAEELPEPIASEFRLLHDRQSYGLPVPDALKSFAERVPIMDARFFVTAVLTQREAGGNLAEVLDNLSSVIRDRFNVKRQVRVLSAHGRITGWILGALPVVMAVFTMIVSPNHFRTLINDPLGTQMITVAVALQIIGTLIIRRLVDIEY